MERKLIVALLTFLDWLLSIIGGIMIGYQVLYMLIGMFVKPFDFPQAPSDKRYAILISARNEENVIGELIHSIRTNDYPQYMIDIWLIADNCTDHTADYVRSLGEHVIERHDTEHIGKGYALTYLLNQMSKLDAIQQYDAFLVFDADNILDPQYIRYMNDGFHAGFKILTSYRNSKNVDNWVSSGAALWFIRESRFLNNTRMFLHSSCHVGGTGFMFSREIMERNDGWKFHLLTEDIEFTLDSVIHGDRVGYVGQAILYDEQPTSFAQSWRQRVRWSKGFLQVFRYYGEPLIKKALVDGDFSSVDMMLMICPLTILWAAREILGLLFAACGFVTWQSQFYNIQLWIYSTIWSSLIMMVAAAITVVAERKKIGATSRELIAYVLSFPLYALSYVPISFVALFSKSSWKPIAHHKQNEVMKGKK